MVSYNEVTKLYVATFNRAPDSAGLNYWVYNSGLTLAQIAQSFFVQSETQIKYPISMSNRNFIEEVYSNLFNREPDREGWDYWEYALESGDVTKDNFILAVINGALDDDKVILENKQDVGLSFAQAGLNDVNFAISVMSNVNATSQSVLNAENQINSYSNNALSFFDENYLNNKIFYQIITDEMDDNNNGITDEYIIIAMKYQNSHRYIDFTISDDFNNFSDTGTYTINNGKIIIQEGDGDTETNEMIYDNHSTTMIKSFYNHNSSNLHYKYWFDSVDTASQSYTQLIYGYIPFSAESGLGENYLNGKIFYSINLNSLEGNTRFFTNNSMKTGDTINDFNDPFGESYTVTSDGMIKLQSSDAGTVYFKLIDITDEYLLMQGTPVSDQNEFRFYKFYFNKEAATNELAELLSPNNFLDLSEGFTPEWIDGKTLYTLNQNTTYLLQLDDGYQRIYTMDGTLLNIDGVNYDFPYTLTSNGYLKVNEAPLNDGIETYEYYKIIGINDGSISLQEGEIYDELNGVAIEQYFFTNYNLTMEYLI